MQFSSEQSWVVTQLCSGTCGYSHPAGSAVVAGLPGPEHLGRTSEWFGSLFLFLLAVYVTNHCGPGCLKNKRRAYFEVWNEVVIKHCISIYVSMQLLTVNGKSRSHWRMAEWLVLSQLILRVPLLERGLSSSCRSGLLRKLCAVQIWMSSVFSCCCAGISGKKWSLVFLWEMLCFLLSFGPLGQCKLCFLLLFTAQQGQTEKS